MTLGKNCTTFTLAIKGEATVAAARSLVNGIIQAIGMSPIFEPTVYQYAEDVGIIYIQPIYESFVAFDAWPKHGGGYLTVTSCRNFEPGTVTDEVERQGYHIVDDTYSELDL